LKTGQTPVIRLARAHNAEIIPSGDADLLDWKEQIRR
jgi:hypothetical protein